MTPVTADKKDSPDSLGKTCAAFIKPRSLLDYSPARAIGFRSQQTSKESSPQL
jgi:hypothetical protein